MLTPTVPIDDVLLRQVSFITGVATDGTLTEDSYWGVNGVTAFKSGEDRAAGTSGGTITYGFDPDAAFTAAEKATFREVFALWSAVADVHFAEASSFADAGTVLLRGTDGGAYWTAELILGSGDQLGSSTDGLISIDTSLPFFGLDGDPDDAFGGYGLGTAVHEVGHLLGLGHAGPYNGEMLPEQQYGPFDSALWTVMSYATLFGIGLPYEDDYPVKGTDWGIAGDGKPRQSPHTFMPLDILAIQQIYGVAKETPLSGGQVFGFNTNIVGPLRDFYDFTYNRHPIVTLWNAGTGNALDLSGYAADATLDLRDGHFSSFNGMVNNLAIAFGTVIETGIGGAGNDLIQGSARDNDLRGGAGDDVLVGGAGSDILDGGAGLDEARVGGLDGAGFGVVRYDGGLYTLDRAARATDVNTGIERFAQLSGKGTMDAGAVRTFDALAYAASYDDLALAFRADADVAFSHYVNKGFFEHRETGFDAAQYLVNYADLRAAFGTGAAGATQHYLLHGVNEHRLAADPLDYVAGQADLTVAFRGLSAAGLVEAGLTHYRDHGAAEGRRSGITFDADQYLANHADLRAAFGADGDAGAVHFISFGYAEHRLDADPFLYAASYADLTTAFRAGGTEQIRLSALDHYRAYGFDEGRHAGIDFDAEQYLANYADLRDAFVRSDGTYDEQAATLHYLVAGFGEGRVDAVL